MQNNVRCLGMVAVTLLASAAWHAPAFAQAGSNPSPASPDAATADAPTNEDIVVTARRRSERLLDVPSAVTALSGAEVARYATTSLESLGNLIPQVEITPVSSGTGATVTIRGIGTNNTGDDSFEQAVSFNVDGVPTARGRILQQALFDLQSVQVLKGPQALYFGKNSPAGVIILQSNGPTAELSGYARAGYEFKADEVIGEAAISGPLSDDIGFRVAVRGSDMSGGYVHNIAPPVSAANNPVTYDRRNGIALPGASYDWGPGAKQYAGRVTLAYDPAGPFKATLKVTASHYKDNGAGSTTVQLKCPAGYPRGAVQDLGALAFGLPPGIAQDPNGVCDPKRRISSIGDLPPSLSNYPGANGGVPFLKNNNYLGSLEMGYTAGQVELTSITGFYKYSLKTFNNFDYSTDGLVNGVANSSSKSFSQELRAITSFEGSLNVSVGGFYGHDKRTSTNANTVLRAVDPTTGSYISSADELPFKGDTYSLVGELIWKPVAEIEVSGGARYTHEKKEETLRTIFRATGIAAAVGLYRPVGEFDSRFKANNVSPQATISWRPTPQANFFFGYRTGFKSGGIISPAFVPTTATPTNVVYQNEKIKGVEGGLKYETVDRRISGDITIYHYLYKGLQVSTFDANTNALRVQNAGGAQIDGVEATARFAVDSQFSVHAAGGYNRARFTTFINAGCYGGQTAALGCTNRQQNLTGRQLPRAPDWAGSIGATWDGEITSGFRLGATVDGRYTSKTNVNSNLNPDGVQRAYTLFDASLRLHDDADRWELALIGKNITNKFYKTVSTDRPLGIAPGSQVGTLGLPRTVQVQGTYNF